MLVLLGGVAVTRSVLGGQPAPVLNPGLLAQDATPAQLAAGRWEALPPLAATERGRRMDPAVVWTGRQLIVWGGARTEPFRSLTDGAAYDPATRQWTPLSPAPEGQWLERGTAVWTGRELLVGGVGEAEAGGVTVAGYDPAANRWRRLPPSPGLTRGPGHLQARSAMWSGNRLLVWSFWGDTARDAMDGSDPLPRPDAEPDGIDLWAYDPAGDRWLRLPAGPDRAATPPAGRGSLERALLRTVQRESGAVQVYVLVPAGP